MVSLPCNPPGEQYRDGQFQGQQPFAIRPAGQPTEYCLRLLQKRRAGSLVHVPSCPSSPRSPSSRNVASHPPKA